MPAPNERFGKMAGVAPLKSRDKLVTACSADTSVRPATTPSRHHVSSNSGTGQCNFETKIRKTK